jgi:Ca2+-binding EF-hand superfamily protein
VASAIVSETGGKLTANVLAAREDRMRRETLGLTADTVSSIVADAGYTLLPDQVKFVDGYKDLPSMEHRSYEDEDLTDVANYHDRLVLLDLLRACFAEADVDGDGLITLAEFKLFLERQDIPVPGEEMFTDVEDKRDVRSGLQLLAFAKHDTNKDFVLEFEEFKNFLLNMPSLTQPGEQTDTIANARGTEDNLARVLAKYFFAQADSNKDGLISENETRLVLKCFGFDGNDIKAAFGKYDVERRDAINQEQFGQLLFEKGVIRPAEDKRGAK